MQIKTYEILINATLLTTEPCAQLYEFVLNQDLIIIEYMEVHSLANNQVSPVWDHTVLTGMLFELNHVRINPYIDNTYIINKLSQALEHIGVNIKHAPHLNDIAQCYRPLGEIMENVRFHFNEIGHCIFLCPHAKLRLVPKEPTTAYRPRL